MWCCTNAKKWWNHKHRLFMYVICQEHLSKTRDKYSLQCLWKAQRIFFDLFFKIEACIDYLEISSENYRLQKMPELRSFVLLEALGFWSYFLSIFGICHMRNSNWECVNYVTVFALPKESYAGFYFLFAMQIVDLIFG